MMQCSASNINMLVVVCWYCRVDLVFICIVHVDGCYWALCVASLPAAKIFVLPVLILSDISVLTILLYNNALDSDDVACECKNYIT